jgi:hypothetical protein
MTAAPHDPPVAGRERAVGRPNRGQGGLGQGGPQPAVAPPCLSGLVLPGTLVIAGTQARPTSQVPVTGELAHVHPQFGDEDFSGALGDAVDAIQPRQFLSERGDDLVDPFTQGRDGLIDIVRIPAIVNSESGRS